MFLEVHAWSTGHTTSNGVYIYNGKEKMYGKVGPRLVSCKGIDSFVLAFETVHPGPCKSSKPVANGSS